MSAQNGRRVALGKRSGRGRKQGRGRGKGEWAGCAGGGRQGAGEAGRGCQDLQEGTALPASGLQPPECEETLSPAFSHLSQQPWGTKICPVQSVGWGHSLPPPWEHTHPPAPLLFQVHSMILGPVPRPVCAGPYRSRGLVSVLQLLGFHCYHQKIMPAGDDWSLLLPCFLLPQDKLPVVFLCERGSVCTSMAGCKH